MKRVVIIFSILYLLITYKITCENNDRIIDLVNEGIFESIDKGFELIEGASSYSHKYELSEKELDILGIWALDIYTTELNRDDYGAGISIRFLPNRFFSIFKNDRNAIGIKHIIGEWKIVNDELLVKFKARIVKQDSNKNTTGELRVEKMETDYFKIFEVPDYELAYVNDKPFKWDTLPDSVIQFYDIDKEDMPRFRLLFDTLGVPPGDITADSEFGKVLLNPQNTDDYFIQLSKIW